MLHPTAPQYKHADAGRSNDRTGTKFVGDLAESWSSPRTTGLHLQVRQV